MSWGIGWMEGDAGKLRWAMVVVGGQLSGGRGQGKLAQNRTAHAQWGRGLQEKWRVEKWGLELNSFWFYMGI